MEVSERQVENYVHADGNCPEDIRRAIDYWEDYKK